MEWAEQYKVVFNGSEEYYIYALFCQDQGGQGYVKFGRSCRIMKRLSEIRTGCPIPAKMFAACKIGSYYKCLDIERDLHRRFKPRRSSGEWYRFTFDNPEDKADFNEGTREVFRRHLKTSLQWSVMSVGAYDKMTDERKRAWIYGPARSAFERQRKDVARRRYEKAQSA